ncbi:hypothetical protein HYH03_003895 [Edaphochlamys debaryana]|uniref:Rab-GAP TBC domain-containing protein n=1 Tax=Edaphochlamys debaryana TaxID=47281 RepID=A0A835Y8C3_9CHLO|nr:hypothetical protein HYH03_003895 [Edaphochlamys debaryana]|eukprot:KAG2498137.1 hypothetical protein HYH03_003895 [Edaphochlamys debaryana]
MDYAKNLLSKAKELAATTAAEVQNRVAQLDIQAAAARATSPSASSRDASQAGSVSANAGTTMTTGAVQSVESRVARFQAELRGSTINIHNLKRLAFHGIPDHGNLRATVWKLLLGYLPLCPEEWPKELAKRRTQYHIFCDELIVDPSKDSDPGPCSPTSGGAGGSAAAGGPGEPGGSGASASTSAAAAGGGVGVGGEGANGAGGGGGGAERSGSSTVALWDAGRQASGGVPVVDHPLSLSKQSKWNTFFTDTETMVQVERDVMRTHPDMHFFTGDSPEAEQHREDLKRALFMYAKLNPGLRYIQGMNELIAPLYYLFRTDATDPAGARYAEADAFWCFMELISDFRDHFCAQLDNAQTGIRATIRRLMLVLQYHDKPLWYHMEIVQKVDPQFYAFRWLTLLLSQEFSFPDVLRIWDTILSDPAGRMDCLLRICVAMILNVKATLRAGDFTVIMKTLQRYPPVDVNVLLQRAAEMPPCATILGTSV